MRCALWREETVKKPGRPVKESSVVLPAWRGMCSMDRMVDSTVATFAAPSALERYGVGWDDEPPSRLRTSA
jgi:hypothetical protein